MSKPTTRRLLQQAKHCIEEALAVVEAGEHAQHAVDDAEHALELLASHIVPELQAQASRSE